jgi:hypothetical protein
MPDFSVEVDLEGPYEPVVWLHGEFGKIRAAWDTPLRELARVATFLPDVPYWAFAAEEGSTRPAFSWDLAVPYSRARGAEATHVLLFDVGTDRCIGHLPAGVACDEALAAARKVWDEVEDSWRRVTPAFSGSSWSAGTPGTPDTPESAGSAE